MIKCRKGKEIQILRSGAGYYLGTVTEDGCPNCRVSIGYAPTYEKAKELLPDRVCEENMFCNGYKGCNIKFYTEESKRICVRDHLMSE